MKKISLGGERSINTNEETGWYSLVSFEIYG